MGRSTRGEHGGTGAVERPRRRHVRRVLIGRTVAALALLPLAGRLPSYARLTAALLRDPRVPATRKAVLAAVLGYAAVPFDVIPDRLPILGSLDDLAIAVLGYDLFIAGIPEQVIDEKLAELGIPRAAWDEDIARVRRIIPRPVRRVIHHVPSALGAAGRAAGGLARSATARGTLSKEGSPA